MADIRMKIMHFNTTFFEMMFRHEHAYQVLEGIPDGALIRSMGYDFRNNTVYLIIEHESFELVPAGLTLPQFSGMIQPLGPMWPEKKDEQAPT
jgi:hypothetical protein